jgi:spore maturation protein CgeB
MKKRVILVGIPKATHVGLHLMNAAPSAGLEMSVMNLEDAYVGPRLVRMAYWRLLGHRPTRLESFSGRLVTQCRRQKPDMVLTTGLAPINAKSLLELTSLGIPVANFLTDDPWNPAHKAPWFMSALRNYGYVFTPRIANQDELRGLKGPQINYLPFAYAPEVHHPPPAMSQEEKTQWESGVLFIGGADDERAHIMREMTSAQIRPQLWGGYWDRYDDLCSFAMGHTTEDTFRKLVANAAVNLCLVRRANRDGHSMRSFELPAVGGCLLVEDTFEHRQIFGQEGECVRFFDSPTSLVQQTKRLLADPAERERLALAVRARICPDDRHTYGARLRTIAAICDDSPAKTPATLCSPSL